MDLNNRKMKNHPPSPSAVKLNSKTTCTWYMCLNIALSLIWCSNSDSIAYVTGNKI